MEQRFQGHKLTTEAIQQRALCVVSFWQYTEMDGPRPAARRRRAARVPRNRLPVCGPFGPGRGPPPAPGSTAPGGRSPGATPSAASACRSPAVASRTTRRTTRTRVNDRERQSVRSVPFTGQDNIDVSNSPSSDDARSVQVPEHLHGKVPRGKEELSSSDTTSSPSSSSTSSMSPSNTDHPTEDTDRMDIWARNSDSTEWWQDASTADDATGERVIVSRRLPKHDGSPGPA